MKSKNKRNSIGLPFSSAVVTDGSRAHNNGIIGLLSLTLSKFHHFSLQQAYIPASEFLQ